MLPDPSRVAQPSADGSADEPIVDFAPAILDSWVEATGRLARVSIRDVVTQDTKNGKTLDFTLELHPRSLPCWAT